MNNKKILNLLTIVVFVGLLGYSIYKLNKDEEETVEKDVIPTMQQQTQREESEIEEGYIIITRTTYRNNSRLITRIYSTGEIERCSVKDETVIQSDYKEAYTKVGTLTEDELKTVLETVEKMKSQEMKKDNFSSSYGISINTNKKGSVLYSAEYFNQEDVNTIYNIINKY